MAQKKDKNIDTLATHAGRMSDSHFGAVNTPVYRASTILHPDLKTLENSDQPYVYGRKATPTSQSLTDALSELEGGAQTVLCPSGMNAIALAILSVCSAGDHILVADNCYGPTRIFCDKMLSRFGVEVTYYEPTIGGGITGLMQANTRAVFCESPGSLTFEVQDIPAIADVAHARGASVLLDNTWATPIYFNAIAHGVDLSVQATTKYVGGHADVMMGYVTANDAHVTRLLNAHNALGLYASGDDCFLALRGLRTLPLRLARHQENGLKLARWLQSRPEIARVLHPALESDPGHALWKRDFTGASGLFGVELKPVAHEALAAFTDELKYFGLGYSWGGYESLIITARIMRTINAFAAQGSVLRIHAGLEDADDLIADLDEGFARMKAKA